MQAQCSGGVEQQHPAKEELLAELHAWQRQLVPRSLDEAIRLIESEKIEKLTGQHIHCIAEYDAITIEGECFFDKAFTRGKEVAACLAYAMEIGWQEALDDMLRLRATLSGSGTAAAPESLGNDEAGRRAGTALAGMRETTAECDSVLGQCTKEGTSSG